MVDPKQPDRLGSLASSVFSQGMLLLSGPASARLLGVTGRGEYALLVIIVTLGSFFGAAGLPTAVTYALASHAFLLATFSA